MAAVLLATEFEPLGLSLNADKTALWSPDAGVQGLLPECLKDQWAFHLPVLGSAIPYVRASYPDAEESDPAAEASACLLYTSPSPRDRTRSRMPSSA